jgi:hypothetical protein
MHTVKKRRITEEEKKLSYSDKFLVASTLTPPRQHLDRSMYDLSQRSYSNKKIVSDSEAGLHTRLKNKIVPKKIVSGSEAGQSSLGKVNFKECFVALCMISVRYPTRE